jgi:hypothetical protein
VQPSRTAIGRRAVERGEDGQRRKQRHREARERPLKRRTRRAGDLEPPVTKIQRAAGSQQPPEDAPRAARLRFRRPGEPRGGGTFLFGDPVQQPGGGRRLRLALGAALGGARVTSRRVHAAGRAGEHRRVRRAAGVLLIGQVRDDARLRPLVENGDRTAGTLPPFGIIWC